MMKQDANGRILLGVLSSLVAGTAAFIALAYVRGGGRGRPSPLLPKMVEDQLDRVTSWLDARLGKAVVDRGMDALQHALRGSAPDKLMQLLEQVIEPDALKQQRELDSQLAKADDDGMTVRRASQPN